MAINLDFNVKNQGGAPAMLEGLDANKPAPGQTGRLYWATNTNIVYRDNGSAWSVFITNTGGTGIAGNVSPNYVPICDPDIGNYFIDSPIRKILTGLRIDDQVTINTDPAIIGETVFSLTHDNDVFNMFADEAGATLYTNCYLTSTQSFEFNITTNNWPNPKIYVFNTGSALTLYSQNGASLSIEVQNSSNYAWYVQNTQTLTEVAYLDKNGLLSINNITQKGTDVLFYGQTKIGNNGANPYNTSAFGITINDPTSNLPAIILQRGPLNANADFKIQNNNGYLGFYSGYDATTPNAWRAPSMAIDSSGFVGIGIVTPTAPLDVRGGQVRFANLTTANEPVGVVGGVYFNTTLQKLRVHTSTGWQTITSV